MPLDAVVIFVIESILNCMIMKNVSILGFQAMYTVLKLSANILFALTRNTKQ